MRAFQFPDATLHYRAERATSAAKTLVFINSLGTDFRLWDGVVERLQGRFNLVLHDKRGHGLSSGIYTDARIATYAQDLELLLKHLMTDSNVLVGISVGGLIAQHMLLHGSLPFKGAVLSNTGLKIGDDKSWNSRIGSIEVDGIESIADAIIERWMSPAWREANPWALATYRAMLARQPQDGYIALCKAIRDNPAFDHEQTRRAIPTLCIAGELDASTPPALVKALSDSIRGATYHEFGGAGHLPCIEQPEAYAELLADFADGL